MSGDCILVPATMAANAPPKQQLRKVEIAVGCEPGKIVVHLIAVDRHLHVNRDHSLAFGGIEVDIVGRLPDAVRHFEHALTGQRLDVVLHLGEAIA